VSGEVPVGDVLCRASMDPHSLCVPKSGIEILVNVSEDDGRRSVGGLSVLVAVVLEAAEALGGEEVGGAVVSGVHPVLVVVTEDAVIGEGVDVRVPVLGS